MSSIIDAFQSITDLIAGDGVSKEDINSAEKELSLRFANDYTEYLLRYGIAAFDGHELTGITKSARVNVVAVTKDEKGLNPNIPDNYYVIECTDYDGIIIWQEENGMIYYSSPYAEPVFLCNSLSEYILR